MGRPAKMEEVTIMKPVTTTTKQENVLYQDTYTFPDELSKMGTQSLLRDMVTFRNKDGQIAYHDKIKSVEDVSTDEKQMLKITTERGWINADRINELITKQFNASVGIVVGVQEQLTKDFQSAQQINWF